MTYFYSTTKTLLLLALFLFHLKLDAQVTIGLGASPEKAALLQLKDRQPAAASKEATATSGGLLLPRVKLNATDDFTLLPNLTPGEEKDHTGLLVYNVEEDASLDLKKGVYQWDGEKWKMLNKITKTEGSTVAKVIYEGNSPNEAKTVTLGIFEFRITNNYYPQIRRVPGSNAAIHHWQVNEYSDLTTAEATALGTGTRFAHKIYTDKTLQAGTWTNCDDALYYPYAEKNEVWLADLDNNNIYQIQFMFLGEDLAARNKTFLIIVQKY
jgi:hypothetical protein